MADVKKALKDENAALGDIGKFQNTIPGSYIEIKAPKWVCSVICANLDIDDLVSMEDTNKLPTNPN